MTLRIDIPWIPDEHHSAQIGTPTGIVFHSGDHRAAVAEAALQMDVSYHCAHHAGLGRIVQLVDLDRRAWHAGAAGNAWIGVAVPGPDEQTPRPDSQRDDVREVVRKIKEAVPSVIWWCRHSDIEAGKGDPGPGFLDSWMDGLLVHGLPHPKKKKTESGGETMKISLWTLLAILGGMGAALAAYYKKTGLAIGTGGASLLLLILHFGKVLPDVTLGRPTPMAATGGGDVTKVTDDPQGEVSIDSITITPSGGESTTWAEDPVTGDWQKIWGKGAS